MAHRRRAYVIVAIALWLPKAHLPAQSPSGSGAALFSRKCGSCHTIGGGKLVGPDLEGVTTRRDRGWLSRFIRSSQQVIRSGDPAAVALFAAFNRQRMPDHDLTDEQLEELLTHLATAYDDAGLPGVPPLERATAADVQRGFNLFVGHAMLPESRAPCAACHAIRHPWTGSAAAAASFAPDLSRAYGKYGAHGLLAVVRRACTVLGPDPRAGRLTAGASFALSAFLRDAFERSQPGAAR